jgi:hypothetical protein
MPRRNGGLKRKNRRGGLEEMTDGELQEIRFFGNLSTNPQTILYRATPDEQLRAASILEVRRALHTDTKRTK